MMSPRLLGAFGSWGLVDEEGVLASWGDSGHHCSLSASVVKSRGEIVSRTAPPRRKEAAAGAPWPLLKGPQHTASSD